MMLAAAAAAATDAAATGAIAAAVSAASTCSITVGCTAAVGPFAGAAAAGSAAGRRARLAIPKLEDASAAGGARCVGLAGRTGWLGHNRFESNNSNGSCAIHVAHQILSGLVVAKSGN